MATKAYLMIQVKKEFYQNGRMEEVLADLKARPEVKRIEVIDNADYDLLVETEAPVRAGITAFKVLALDWVKNLRLLKVTFSYTNRHQEAREVLRVAR